MLRKVPKRKVRKKQELLFDKRKGPALENMVLDAKGQAEEPVRDENKENLTPFRFYPEKPSPQS